MSSVLFEIVIVMFFKLAVFIYGTPFIGVVLYNSVMTLIRRFNELPYITLIEVNTLSKLIFSHSVVKTE